MYNIVKYIHILTLVVAAAITAITKLASLRRKRARTLGELQDWHGVIMSASKFFPLLLALFVITGGYMLSFGGSWSSGFVVGGLVGVTLMLVSGIVLGVKGSAAKQVIDALVAKEGADHPAPRIAPPPVVAALPFMNTGIALAVAYDMVTKPASIPVALTAIAIGAVGGVALGLRLNAGPAVQPSPSQG